MVVLSSSPVASPFGSAGSALTTISNTVVAAQKNIRNGPTTLQSVMADNTVTASNTKVWLKLYDLIDNTFVAGTSRPDIGFPVRAVSTNPVAGVEEVVITGDDDGFRFVNGLSVLASKENGDTMANPPGSALDARFVTKE